MSLQISSGVGNSGLIASIPSATAASTGTTGTQAAPQYQLDFNGLTRSAALGLANPTSVGDLEIIFSQIAAALKDKLGELADLDTVSRAESLRGNRGLVLAAVSLMASMGAEVDANALNAKNKKELYDKTSAEKEGVTTTRNGLAGQKTTLQTWIKGAEESISGSNEAINNLNPRIDAIEKEMRGLKLPEKQARYNELSGILHGSNGLIAQRDAAEANKTTQGRNITGWRNEIRELDGKIGPLNEQIKDLENVMEAAETSRKASAARIVQLGTAMTNFYNNVTSFLLGANSVTQGQTARDAGEVTPEGDSFDQLLSNLARALVTLGDLMSDNSRIADIIDTPGGAGLSGTDSTPDRFGQMSAPVARAVAFAGLVGATMSALVDVLRGLSAGLGMQTAGDFAAAGQARVRVGL